ncbi:MAG: hypothetical protein COC05_06785 [Gammaproteobacteria bacterium]|nr:MAG: hypothetical protein COC05_06785 [Gammaproteobacteria bacterium]
MKITILKAGIIVLFYFLITACDSNDCRFGFGVAADQLRLADTINNNNKTYYLYTRTTGWNDKIVFFELYDQKPEFDPCTYQPDIEYLYTIDYEDYPENPKRKHIEKMILQPDQPEKLKIIYTTDKTKGVENVYDVKFTR